MAAPYADAARAPASSAAARARARSLSQQGRELLLAGFGSSSSKPHHRAPAAHKRAPHAATRHNAFGALYESDEEEEGSGGGGGGADAQAAESPQPSPRLGTWVASSPRATSQGGGAWTRVGKARDASRMEVDGEPRSRSRRSDDGDGDGDGDANGDADGDADTDDAPPSLDLNAAAAAASAEWRAAQRRPETHGDPAAWSGGGAQHQLGRHAHEVPMRYQSPFNAREDMDELAIDAVHVKGRRTTGRESKPFQFKMAKQRAHQMARRDEQRRSQAAGLGGGGAGESSEDGGEEWAWGGG